MGTARTWEPAMGALTASTSPSVECGQALAWDKRFLFRQSLERKDESKHTGAEDEPTAQGQVNEMEIQEQLPAAHTMTLRVWQLWFACMRLGLFVVCTEWGWPGSAPSPAVGLLISIFIQSFLIASAGSRNQFMSFYCKPPFHCPLHLMCSRFLD